MNFTISAKCKKLCVQKCWSWSSKRHQKFYFICTIYVADFFLVCNLFPTAYHGIHFGLEDGQLSIIRTDCVIFHAIAYVTCFANCSVDKYAENNFWTTQYQ